ncbi:hypothetical protein EFZ10_08265 [Tatumella sp. TA1]|nr:hypothetical protein EFZ10_08265 [Tatumella sp. TA1]
MVLFIDSPLKCSKGMALDRYSMFRSHTPHLTDMASFYKPGPAKARKLRYTTGYSVEIYLDDQGLL